MRSGKLVDRDVFVRFGHCFSSSVGFNVTGALSFGCDFADLSFASPAFSLASPDLSFAAGSAFPAFVKSFPSGESDLGWKTPRTRSPGPSETPAVFGRPSARKTPLVLLYEM